MMTVRAEKKKHTVHKIVGSFYELLQEKDYEKISIRDIKNKAKVSIGAIYHHFPQGKVDILHETISRNRDKILNINLFNDIVESDLKKSIKMIMLNFIKFHRENLKYHLAFEQVLITNREIFHDFKVLIEEALGNLAKKIINFKLFTNISEKELKEKLFLLFNIIEAIILRHILIFPLFKTDDKFADYLTDLVMFHSTI